MRLLLVWLPNVYLNSFLPKNFRLATDPFYRLERVGIFYPADSAACKASKALSSMRLKPNLC